MSTHPGQQTDFGANEWLVYEIHQQYLKDPDSVSEQWREFLSDYSPGEPAGSGRCRRGQRQRRSRRRHVPRARAARGRAAAGAGARRRPGRAGGPAAAPAAVRPAGRADTRPVAVPGRQGRAGRRRQAGRTGRRARRARPAPRRRRCKGAASRVVTNMNASLTVPTATSVRAVPAKLLADNRIVINNHLRRTRGGKVSLHAPDRLRAGARASTTSRT